MVVPLGQANAVTLSMEKIAAVKIVLSFFIAIILWKQALVPVDKLDKIDQA